MNLKNLSDGNNLLIVFLMILVVIVIIDCNTKMFSKMVEGNSNGGTPNYVGSCGAGGVCGRDCSVPQKNPLNATIQNCDASAEDNGVNNNNNNVVKPTAPPKGYDSDLVLYASADKPLGPIIPKTMQQDYSVLKAFGLTKMPNVINYIPGEGPQQFQKVVPGANANVNRNNNNANRNNNNANNNAVSKTVDIRMYFAPWCGWSKKTKPEMDKLIEKHDGTTMDGVNIKATIVDSEEQKEETKKQGINGFPTFKAHLMKGGKEVTNYVLELPERTLDALENAVKEAVEKIKSM